jgi:lipopolysaccharide transport system ATP-binding protein
MFQFMEQGKILVFASHSRELLKQFCDHTIWLERGEIRMSGVTDEILTRYTEAHGTAPTDELAS